MMTVAARLAEVRERIVAACDKVGREADAVTIVAVCKLQPEQLVRQAIEAGVAELGENRVGRLVERAAAHPEVRWHHVGQLQSRKARDAVGMAALIHSLDRPRLADAIDRRARERGIVQDVLVQVDASRESGRGGVAVDGVEALVEYAADLPGVRVTGLMTIPPIEADPRRAFDTLRQLRDRLSLRWPSVTHLSMGMSNDYEIAVEEGATIVRPGTAIFGERPQGQGGRHTA